MLTKKNKKNMDKWGKELLSSLAQNTNLEQQLRLSLVEKEKEISDLKNNNAKLETTITKLNNKLFSKETEIAKLSMKLNEMNKKLVNHKLYCEKNDKANELETKYEEV